MPQPTTRQVATILCPGPSLKKLVWEKSKLPIGHILAVNIARDHVPWHDWWVAGDAGIMGEDGWCDHNHSYEKWQPDDRTKQGVFSIHRTKHPVTILWSSIGVMPTSYSSIAALYLAFHLGAQDIHVYGHDMAGSEYYNGNSIDPLSAPSVHFDRWKNEARLYNATVDFLQSSPRQIKITRHTL